jgi:PPOX class probable FMN-dependent enzyme
MILSSADSAGYVDISPKGGPPGFVAVLDDNRLAVPDMSGNNRLDSMRNIVSGGRVALLFLVPGVDETLRVNGAATVSVDSEVLSACLVNGMEAKVAIVVEVETAFIHCAKALKRGSIWSPEKWPDVSDLASPACMLKDHIGLPGSIEDSQRRLDESYAATTWKMAGD